MKKVITILLSVLLIAGLFTGCNGDALAEMIGGGDTPVPTPTPEPFRFVAEEATTVSIESYIDGALQLNEIRLQYKIDDGEWQNYVIADNPSYTPGDVYGRYVGPTISLDVGQKLFIKAGHTTDTNHCNPSFGAKDDLSNDWSYYRFVLGNDAGGKVKAEGNIMFLLDETGESLTVDDYAFFYLFDGCKNLTSVPMLPATELADFCYDGMFYGCEDLVSVPKKLLPATELAEACYLCMFDECTSLTDVCTLPATQLADNCYCGMFANCTSLTEAPDLPATQLAYSCYLHMFKNCTFLMEAPDLPATTMAEQCYFGMFEGCTSLEEAPDLPATQLAISCYCEMFANCTSLASVTMLATDISADYCLYDWLYNVGTDGTLKVSNDTVKTDIVADVGNSAPKDGGFNSLVGSGWTVTVNP